MSRRRAAEGRPGRVPTCALAALAFLLAAGPSGSAAAPDGPPAPDLSGGWKLVAEAPGSGDLEWAIIAIRPEGDRLRAEVIAMRPPSRTARAYAEASRDSLVLVVTTGYEDLAFKAPLGGDRPPDRIPGLFRFRHLQVPVQATLPARIERTGEKDLAPPEEQPGGEGGDPAPAAGVLGQFKAASEWKDPRYRPLDLRLARRAAEAVPPDATTEEHLWAARRLAEAAKAAGPPELAAEAESKVAEWRGVLAEENRLPPGPPEPKGIRRGEGEDRVVLMELFTGAECEPCAPADRAFDILAGSLPPAELIAIQYHLHIPAPDPLANPDAEARAEYYGARGTPSTYFNGRPRAGGGAPPPGQDRKKYNQYRRVVESLLRGPKGASIALEAMREGDEVRIKATAEVPQAAAEGRLRLRIVLVEGEVPYAGGNGVKAHHRVARALPGGPDGYPLEDGRARAECTIRLDQVRSSLGDYLAGYPESPDSRGAFPRALPPIEFRKLSAIAFVQDDATKEVLHAVEAPIADGPMPREGFEREVQEEAEEERE